MNKSGSRGAPSGIGGGPDADAGGPKPLATTLMQVWIRISPSLSPFSCRRLFSRFSYTSMPQTKSRSSHRFAINSRRMMKAQTEVSVTPPPPLYLLYTIRHSSCVLIINSFPHMRRISLPES